MIRFGQRLGAIVASLLLVAALGAPPAVARTPSWSHRDAHVCGQPGAGKVRCTSVARAFYLDGREYQAARESDLAAAAAAAQASYYNGTSIRTAYGISAQGDPSQVVAIVDANDDPNAFANLTRFRSDSGLPAIQSCALATLTGLTSSAGSPCFTKTDQTGGTSLPSADAGWSNEIDLDLQAASSVCPMCSILLLEATSASIADLGTAVTTASSTAHVLAISNSYGISGDYPGSIAPAFDSAAKKGIAVTASAGDGGYGVLFPASATNVIGVGGTTLSVSGTTGKRTSETAWSGTGSGCSVYNSAPAWQSIPGNPCAGKKAVSDLSADADPNSGLAIYTTYSGVTGYWVFGGTSLSSPLVAALYAMNGGYNASTLAGQYAWAAGTPYYDVTSGSNGTCSPSVLCTAAVGWDGPTGRGSITVAASSPVLTTIRVSPTTASVQASGTQQFTATGYDQNGVALSSQPTFGWSVSGGGSIGTSGLFTAGSTAGGPFTVTASSGSVTGTASVTVTAIPVLTTITVSPSSASVQTNGTQQFAATGKDQFGKPMSPQPAFTWSVSGGGSIGTSGLFTAGSTTGGPFTVTASSGSVTGTASVTVTAVAPDFAISVMPSSRSVRRGSTATYSVAITPSGGFAGALTLSLTGQPSGSTWTFTPNNTALTASTLTVATLSTTSRRTYTLTIRAVSGSLNHTSNVTLTVTR
jgi:hypothetical protein